MNTNLKRKLSPLLDPDLQERIIAWAKHREEIALNKLVNATDLHTIHRAQGEVQEARALMRMRDYIIDKSE